LLYVDPDSEDMHAHLDPIERPLNTLDAGDLCPALRRWTRSTPACARIGQRKARAGMAGYRHRWRDAAPLAMGYSGCPVVEIVCYGSQIPTGQIPPGQTGPVHATTTQYARSGDVHIAYQAFGDGPDQSGDGPGFRSNVENYGDQPTSRVPR